MRQSADTAVRTRWYFGLAAILLLHNAEEALEAPRMLDFAKGHWPDILRALQLDDVTVAQFRITLAIISIAGLGLAAVASRNPGNRGWTRAMLVLASILGLNAISHIGLCLYFRGYMGGVITALVMLPFSFFFLRRARRFLALSSH